MDDQPAAPTAEAVFEALPATATVATAESVTGGLVGTRLTATSGASDHFRGGVVTYTYRAKCRLLGIARETLDTQGAVSAETAREMARRIRDREGATWGVSTTGVAGPAGGGAAKPVGTVFVGVAFAAPWDTDGSYAAARRYEFEGGRQAVREAAADRALSDLLLEVENTHTDRGTGDRAGAGPE